MAVVDPASPGAGSAEDQFEAAAALQANGGHASVSYDYNKAVRTPEDENRRERIAWINSLQKWHWLHCRWLLSEYWTESFWRRALSQVL